MSNPERDYCEGRFLSLARELVAAGYKHRHIAQAGLSVAGHHAMEEGSYYHFKFLENTRVLCDEGLALMIRLAEEEAKERSRS